MEMNMYLKNYLRAVFIIALIFTGLDPRVLQSQCVDVHSSPCYVNISDIPYSMFNAMYRSRSKDFYEKIKGDSIYADTCNTKWLGGESNLYYHEFELRIKNHVFNKPVNIGDSNLTIDDINDEFIETKKIIENFESKYCKLSFLIIYIEPDSYSVKAKLEKHIQMDYMVDYWFNNDSNYKYFSFLYCTVIIDPSTSNVYQTTDKRLQIKQIDDDNIIIRDSDFNYDKNIEIYNLLGNKLISNSISGIETTVNISVLERGVYFIKIGNSIQKFIKE